MCHWQRWPHIAAAIVGLLGGGFLPRRYAVTVAMLTILLVAASGLIGLYHTGVMYHVVGGPAACTVDHAYVLGSNMPVEARCDLPVYVQGLVMPAWNALISFLIAGAAIFFLRDPHAQKA